ncbi:unnamed protein product [Schistosoma turkestanicum]|nr:unnamed protein product [Schistosoma turkestanicum]CAH8432740.1 unnamed protein product [Schistosoma turkestanicum]
MAHSQSVGITRYQANTFQDFTQTHLFSQFTDYAQHKIGLIPMMHFAFIWTLTVLVIAIYPNVNCFPPSNDAETEESKSDLTIGINGELGETLRNHEGDASEAAKRNFWDDWLRYMGPSQMRNGKPYEPPK